MNNIQEKQHTLKEKYYTEAIRYMNNAKEQLIHANREGKFYQDKKYVRTACGTAYSGVLVALDGYLQLKGIDKPKGRGRKSIEYYQMHIAKIDKKLLSYLNSAYETLHLAGYYDGNQNADVIKAGFSVANTIIDKIKPNGAAK
jgi:hypothetical protein